MRLFQVLFGIGCSAGLGYLSLVLQAMLFGTCCGQSAWSSPDVSIATKGGLLGGSIVTALAALVVLFWGFTTPRWEYKEPENSRR